MGMHPIDDLMRRWQREDVTAEQMVGQLVQHIGVLYDRLRLLERRFTAIQHIKQLQEDTKSKHR
jgi:hypothetical protein